MFRRILVATDGSPQATLAVRAAADLARRYRATVTLLHAYHHVSDLIGTPYYDRLLESRVANAEALLSAAHAEIGNGVVVETQLIEGPPAAAILRVALEEKHDLIVIGSRGHSQLASMVLGSVSGAVAQRAPCPVLIVRELKHEE
ncbi:MAG: universal stress protein [Chloroflexaceae bacterium]|jgi:nucleotide-binding universal stress UspA family protein|nr:universal stress protein [Chloroflexaceae bacterium]